MIIYGGLVAYFVETCCKCSVNFAMPQGMQSKRLEDGESFYCPNGHQQHYVKTTVQKLTEENAALLKSRDFERQRKEEEQNEVLRMCRRYNGLLGQLARVKKQR